MTGLVVCYNTKELLETSLNSVRKFHFALPIMIIDNSDREDPCYLLAESLKSEITEVIHTGENIGHGKGMDFGLRKIKTEFALIFDSDIEMLNSPVVQMLTMVEPDTFGVGWICEIGPDGYDYGTPGKNHVDAIPYLHPYFQLINVSNYKKYAPYCHHGSPCYKTMIDIYRKGLSKKILKSFPGLGHTSGEGINWIGKPSKYVRHDFGGTRLSNKLSGKNEIIGQWDRTPL